jgi:SAM-dependent methyltransferase
MESGLYGILDNPIVYRISQAVFAPGAHNLIPGHIGALYKELPQEGLLLDAGCGPWSWLSTLGLHPIGLDLNPAYVQQYAGQGEVGVVGSVADLPFPPDTFDGVWCLLMLHHLPDRVVAAGIQEFIRVCKPGGYVVIMDGIWPRSNLLRPWAAIVRALDRGRYSRRQGEFEALLPNRHRWSTRRRNSSYAGSYVHICGPTKASGLPGFRGQGSGVRGQGPVKGRQAPGLKH